VAETLEEATTRWCLWAHEQARGLAALAERAAMLETERDEWKRIAEGRIAGARGELAERLERAERRLAGYEAGVRVLGDVLMRGVETTQAAARAAELRLLAGRYSPDACPLCGELGTPATMTITLAPPPLCCVRCGLTWVPGAGAVVVQP